MKAHTINPRAFGTVSLTNALMAASAQPKPEPGMGATIVMYTDLHACTIIDVTKMAVTIMEDIATRTDANGMSESQDYSYAFNVKAKPQVFTRRKTGRYVRRGERVNGTHLVIGTRDHYIDPSF